jgi:hypothetical protein
MHACMLASSEQAGESTASPSVNYCRKTRTPHVENAFWLAPRYIHVKGGPAWTNLLPVFAILRVMGGVVPVTSSVRPEKVGNVSTY